EGQESFVASRAARQQILDTDRQFQSIITEGALRWHVGSPQIMPPSWSTSSTPAIAPTCASA
ncbi:MAG TPA: Scr1 family TA system antitoxin-like transcriptional regulator, partial [Kribbella sp.]